MGAWRPKHVEWPCRNKTCTVLHQVGVSFDLYCDARKQKIEILYMFSFILFLLSFQTQVLLKVNSLSRPTQGLKNKPEAVEYVAV